MLNSNTSTVDKSTNGSISRLESTPKPTVTTDQRVFSKYFENLQDGTGNSAFVPLTKESFREELKRMSAEPKGSPNPRVARVRRGYKETRGKAPTIIPRRACRMSVSYAPSKEDSEEEMPESTPEQESKIKSLQTLVAKQKDEIVEYQEEMTILQLEKEKILEEVCTLKRKIDELQGEDEVNMNVSKKVTGHTMKKSAFWNLVTFNPFKSVKRSDNVE
ncbi:predicted protein [Chaetoceros tenuissimus]|uniref:Uncharacterized protein n=1 Tax=Chaetoceros tenuissimus TaxID=426638 RepID=A0AAD3CEZ0_9STRA|nr:predicted protein [Chaetoceros tenuissimus]